MDKDDCFWMLSEDDRANVITAARTLARKLDIPYDEAFELVRWIAALWALRDRRPTMPSTLSAADTFLSGTDHDFRIESNPSILDGLP